MKDILVSLYLPAARKERWHHRVPKQKHKSTGYTSLRVRRGYLVVVIIFRSVYTCPPSNRSRSILLQAPSIPHPPTTLHFDFNFNLGNGKERERPPAPGNYVYTVSAHGFYYLRLNGLWVVDMYSCYLIPSSLCSSHHRRSLHCIYTRVYPFLPYPLTPFASLPFHQLFSSPTTLLCIIASSHHPSSKSPRNPLWKKELAPPYIAKKTNVMRREQM